MLAFLPSILVFLLLPAFGDKKILQVENFQVHGHFAFYYDLDRDGISEYCFMSKSTPFNHLTIRTIDNKIIEQWNFTDSLYKGISEIFTGNFDKDKFNEVYFFSGRSDSIFLNVLKTPDSKEILQRYFITRFEFINGILFTRIYPVGFFDRNSDGKDELYFTINTGYAKEPRRVFCFDQVNQTVISSAFTGSVFDKTWMKDMDMDGKPEIYGNMTAPANYKTKPPFTDHSSWFMVYNQNLEFEFSPVEFQGIFNSIQVCAFENQGFTSYVLLNQKTSTDTSGRPSSLMLYSVDGKELKCKLKSEYSIDIPNELQVAKYKNQDRIYVINDHILMFDENLDIVQDTKLPVKSGVYSFLADINNDGLQEFLLYSFVEEKLLIYSAGLDKLAEASIKIPDIYWSFSPFYGKNREFKLFLFSGDKSYFLQLKDNKLYYAAYAIYPGIYFLFFSFILIIRKINTRQVVQKEKLRQRLLSLQLKSVKSQMDPHFTFNALNAVAALIYKENRQAAYDYLSKFTSLLRCMLNDAEKIYRSLEEEIEFVRTYLELEKLRFEENFDYEIFIDEKVDPRFKVPKMVLQTYAENAVKHGLLPRGGGGILKIKVKIDGENLLLVIEDNGIGRLKSSGSSHSTGKGLMLTEEFYQILKELDKNPVSMKITDLYHNNGEPAGTRVEVRMPMHTPLE